MTIRSVTFDLDGTLLDTLGDLTAACQAMMKEMDQPLRQREEICRFIGKGMPTLIEQCLTREKPPTSSELAHGIAAFRRHYAEINGRDTTFYPGVQEGLQLFRDSGLKMGLVTNKPTQFTDPLLERKGLSGFFEVVVNGDTTAWQKPHPEPLLHACRALNTAPADNVHIGDSRIDIGSARAAGCVVFCVPYGYNEGQPMDSADCDALVSDLVAAYHRLSSF